VTDSASYFAWFQAQRELTPDELADVVKTIERLRDADQLYGWRITHAPDNPPSVALELDASSEEDAVVRAGMLFLDSLSAAGAIFGSEVFAFAEAARRTR
jgi:hypothetical protein